MKIPSENLCLLYDAFRASNIWKFNVALTAYLLFALPFVVIVVDPIRVQNEALWFNYFIILVSCVFCGSVFVAACNVFDRLPQNIADLHYPRVNSVQCRQVRVLRPETIAQFRRYVEYKCFTNGVIEKSIPTFHALVSLEILIRKLISAEAMEWDQRRAFYHSLKEDAELIAQYIFRLVGELQECKKAGYIKFSASTEEALVKTVRRLRHW